MGKRLSAVLSLLKRKNSTKEPEGTPDVPPKVAETVAAADAAVPEAEKVVAAVEGEAAPVAELAETAVEGSKDEPSTTDATTAVKTTKDAAEVKPSEGESVPKVVPSEVVEAVTAAAVTEDAVVAAEPVAAVAAEPVAVVPAEPVAVVAVEPVAEAEAPTPSADVVVVSESAPANVVVVSESAPAIKEETAEDVVVVETVAAPVAETADAAVKIETPVEAVTTEPEPAEKAMTESKSETDTKAEVTGPEKPTKEVAPEKLHKRSKSTTFFNLFVKQETAKADPVFEATKDEAELAPIEAPKHRRRSSVSFLGCFSKPKAIET